MTSAIRGSAWLFAVLFFLAIEFNAPGAQCEATRQSTMDLNSASTANGTVYFSDDFESGLGKWAMTCTWGLTQTTYRSSNHSLTDSPSANYAPNSDCWAELANPIDLSGADDPVLVFWHKGDWSSGEQGLVEVSMDGGTTWIAAQIFGYYGNFHQSTWSLEQVDLGAYKSGNVKVRFRMWSYDASVDDGWYVDDVRIEEKDTERMPYPFTDNFEGGLDNWIVSGWDWGLTTSTSRSVTRSLTDSPVGDYIPNANCSATLVHPIDLSGSVDPVLVFWHKGDWSSGEQGLVEVSMDGGTTWIAAQIFGYYGNFHQSTWSLEQVDLGAYKSGNVKVRFRMWSYDASVDDGWYVDDVRIEEKDTERMPYPFTDNFEGGLDNWIVSGWDWGLTTSTSRSVTRSLTDSPVGDYIPNANCSATLIHPIDLSGADDPVLVFWHKGDWSSGEQGLVEVSMDGGTTWIAAQIFGYYGNFHQSTWSLEQVDLGAYKSGNVKVRFRMWSYDASVDDGWYVDDVRIEEKDTERMPYPFTDNFEGGLDNWIVSGWDWGLTTSTSRSVTRSLTDSPVGDYIPNANCSATLVHPIDLSGSVDPVLVFWHKGDWSSGEQGLVEVSMDGGTTWIAAQIFGYYGNFHQSTWSLEQVDLGAYKSGNVKVRFRMWSYDASVDDGWYVDDVRIEEKDTERMPYPFTDNFEGGLDNWIVSGWDWGLTTSTSRSVTRSLTDSPVGDYIPNANCSATLVHPIDLSGSVDPVLVFWHKGDWSSGEQGLVEVSMDGGTTWIAAQIFGYYGNFHQSTWSLEQVDLGAYKSGNVKVRFRMWSYDASVDDGWYVDDVRIEEKDTERMPYPFTDSFEGGLDNWIVSGWDWELMDAIPKECTFYRFTHALADSSYIPYSNCSATLPHPIDLSDTIHPVLRFAHRGDIGAGGYGCVDVSTDGGTNWTPLATWGGSWDRSGCLAPDSVDLRDYRSSEVKVRFRLVSNGDEFVGNGWIIDYVSIREQNDVTDVDNGGSSRGPTVLELDQNHPNPFNPSTTIRYYLPDKSGIRLEVYDVSGKRVVCLVDSQKDRGAHTIEWNGKDQQGNAVGSGIYFYRLTVGEQTISKKMVLLR